MNLQLLHGNHLGRGGDHIWLDTNQCFFSVLQDVLKCKICIFVGLYEQLTSHFFLLHKFISMKKPSMSLVIRKSLDGISSLICKKYHHCSHFYQNGYFVQIPETKRFRSILVIRSIISLSFSDFTFKVEEVKEIPLSIFTFLLVSKSHV